MILTDLIEALQDVQETEPDNEGFQRHLQAALDSLAACGDEVSLAADGEEYHWSGPIAFEDQETGDHRIFSDQAIKWDEATLPWAFRWQRTSGQGHGGAIPIGRVDAIERRENGVIFGYGVVIPALNDEASEYVRLMRAGVAGGVSVDGDSAEFVVQDTAEGKSLITFSAMRLRSLTAVDVPAFNNARIKLDARPDEAKTEAATEKTMRDHAYSEKLVASVAPSIGEMPPVQYATIEVCSDHHAFDVKNLLNLFDGVFATPVTDIYPITDNFPIGSATVAELCLKTPTENEDAPLACLKGFENTTKTLTCGCGLTLKSWSNAGLTTGNGAPHAKVSPAGEIIFGQNGGSRLKKDKLALRAKGGVVLSAGSNSTTSEVPVLPKTLIKIIATPKGSSETFCVLLATDPWEDLRTTLDYYERLLSTLNGMDVVLASAIPTKPPTDWFLDPKLSGSEAITVTPEGRVYGYLALFGQCHIGIQAGCTTPPRNGTYKYFHTGEIETEEGELVQIGRLTFNTGHASMGANPKVAAAHYDNTGVVGADVRAGEDEFGIWVVGALRPNLTDAQIREFRAAPLSGDWRRIAGRLELVGALSVNTPGFMVPRARVLVASGETQALITYTESEMVDKKAELAARVAVFADGPCKSEGARGCFPKSDYAYTPEDGPSTWKLRLTAKPGGNPDAGVVGAAVAALGEGFRGNKVRIPAEDLPAVKAKVMAAWHAANPDKSDGDMPTFMSESVEDTDSEVVQIEILDEEFAGLPPALAKKVVANLEKQLAKETDPDKKAEIQAKIDKFKGKAEDKSGEEMQSEEELADLPAALVKKIVQNLEKKLAAEDDPDEKAKIQAKIDKYTEKAEMAVVEEIKVA